MSPYAAVTRALDRACTKTLKQDVGRRTVKVTVVVVPAIADKRWDSMREVEEAEVGIQGDCKQIGYYYSYSVCIYILLQCVDGSEVKAMRS